MLQFIANVVHQSTDFFAQPNWQRVLADNFTAPPGSDVVPPMSHRQSMNSTTTSIPPSPESFSSLPLPARRPLKTHSKSNNPAASRSKNTTELSALLDVAHNNYTVAAPAAPVLASKTPEPDEDSSLLLAMSTSGARRFSFDIPETQAFPGACNDTIPETEAFGAATTAPPPASHEQSNDDDYFRVDAEDYVCSLAATQTQEVLDDDNDAELSALQWPNATVGKIANKSTAPAATTASASVTPDLMFDAVPNAQPTDQQASRSGSATPDLSLSPDSSDDDDDDNMFNKATQMFPFDAFKELENCADENDADANNRSPDKDEQHADCDMTQPFPFDEIAPKAAVLSTSIDDDEDIFAQATQVFVMPAVPPTKAVAKTPRARLPLDDDDVFGQPTQKMPAAASMADHEFAVPGLPTNKSKSQHRGVKTLSLASRRNPSNKPIGISEQRTDEDDVYAAETQIFDPDAAIAKIVKEEEDVCYDQV